MRKRGLFDNKVVFAGILLILIVASILGVVLVKKYIGMAGTYVPAEAGTVTLLEIKMKYNASLWAGVWAFAIWVPGYSGFTPAVTLRGNEIQQVSNMFFGCIDRKNGEIYASTHQDVDWDSISAGTAAEVDNYLGISPSYLMSATNTFTREISVMLGARNISHVPAMYTWQAGNHSSTRFDVGILHDGAGRIVFVTTAIVPSRPETIYSSAPGIYANYQAMLPIANGSTDRYYFYPDPYDTCPSGWDIYSNGTITGLVRDNATKQPLANATVIVGNKRVLTNETGEYSIFTIEGTYTLVGVKDGYEVHTDTVYLYADHTTTYNFDLNPILNRFAFNGTITGNVTDNITGLPIENVTVSIGAASMLTNRNGTYSLVAPAGEYTIVGFKDGYYPHSARVNITSGNATIHDFSMTVPPPTGLGPGQGAGQGPGAGGGGGGGAGSGTGTGVGPGQTNIVIEKPGEIDYYITIESLKKRVRVGQYIEDILRIYNFKDTSLDIRFRLVGDAAPYVRLSTDHLTVGPKSNGDFSVIMFGFNDTGIFTGGLVIDGDINKTIPIELDVRSAEKLPIQALVMKLDAMTDWVSPGGTLGYKNELRNLLTDRGYNVSIWYSITNENRSITKEIGRDTVELQTFVTKVYDYKIPDEFPEGRYILTATAFYLNMTSSTAAVFWVGKPFYMYMVFGFLPLWALLLALLVLLVLVLLYLGYKKREAGKKRYQMKLDLNLLPKPGPRSGYMGKIAETEQKTYLDLDSLTTHAIVAGSTGGGKTIAAQDIIEEALIKGIAIVVFDPTAQWSGMLRKCESKNFLDIYPQFGMKPTDARAFNGNVRAISDAREVIDLKKYLKPGEIQIFTVNKLDPKDIDIFVANTVREVFHANFGESPNLKYMLVYDEVHRLLPKFGGSGEGFIQIERACREFRKWGIGVLLISQVLADFVGQIKANINTEIQMRTRDEGDLKRIATKYGTDQLKSLVRANVGAGMIQNAAYNRGLPYFVQFRPILHSVKRLSDEELDQYNKYNGVIDDCEFQLEQLEQLGMDVFDMKLELKLALDKVKSGSFNMVDIYLEGLTSRLKNEWAKLGKTPKKKTLTLINADALKEELERAKMEHDKAVKDAGVAAGAAAAEQKTLLFEKVFKPLTFDNGAMVSTLIELSDALKGMDDETFKSHVNDRKNDVHKWAFEVVGDKELATKLQQVIDKQGLITLLDSEKKKKRFYDAEKQPQQPHPVASQVAQPVRAMAEKPLTMDEMIRRIHQDIFSGDMREAITLYKHLQAAYMLLPREEKIKYYAEISKILTLIQARQMKVT